MYTILLMLLLTTSVNAQKIKALDSKTTFVEKESKDDSSVEEPEYLNGMVPMATFTPKEKLPVDTLHMPTLNYNGTVMSNNHWYHPFGYGYYGWDLHEGLNMNLGLSAFTSFGGYRFSGTAERISAMYAKPLNNKLSLAVGGYFNNINSNFGSIREAGVTAILDYRFNDHWEAYIYGQKSLVSNDYSRFRFGAYTPYYMYAPMENIGDRIGAGVRYHFNESTYIELQVDWSNYPNQFNRDIKNRSMMPGQANLP